MSSKPYFRAHLPRSRLAMLTSAAVLTISSAHAQTSPDLRRTRLFCDTPAALCLALSPDVDSDGDGHSDADERAAGTNPYDATSQPKVRTLMGLLIDRRLPSAAAGRMMIVAPPTVSPDGRPLASIGSAAHFGGRKGFPARTALLQRLGIDPSTLSSLGVPPSAGFVLQPVVSAAGRTTIVGAQGALFGVTGLRLGQIGAPGGSNPVSLVQSIQRALTAGAGRGATLLALSVDALSGTVRTSHSDGKRGHFGFKNSLVAAGSTTQQSAIITDGSGKTIGEIARTETLSESGLALKITKVIDTGVTTRGEDGTVSTYVYKMVDTLDSSLASETRTRTEIQIQRPDGTVQLTDVKTQEHADNASGESTKITETQVIELDKDGKVTSTITTVTTTTTNSDGETKPSTSVTCTGDAAKNCPKEYENPDAVHDTVVLSSDDVARIVGLLHSKLTNTGTTVLQYLDPQQVKDPNDISPVALIDADGRFQMLLTTPNLWNTGQGTVRTGVTGVDPTDLSPGETPDDRQLRQLMNEALPALPGGAAGMIWPKS